MRGVTITFAPNKSNTATTFDLKKGVVNQYIQPSGNKLFGQLTNLYAKISGTIGKTILRKPMVN